jgi:hypothetical protein
MMTTKQKRSEDSCSSKVVVKDLDNGRKIARTIGLESIPQFEGTRRRHGSIISILVLIEVLAALRGQKARAFQLLKSMASETERTDYVISEAKKIFKKLIKERMLTNPSNSIYETFEY